MSKHTAGPWVHDTRGYPYPDVRAAKDGRGIAITWGVSANPPKSKEAYAQRTEIDRANAKHIVDCVNACEGLPDGCLDGGWTALGASAYANRLETINAELLEALEKAALRFDYLAQFDDEMRNGVRPSAGASECKAAIAKARGEKA